MMRNVIPFVIYALDPKLHGKTNHQSIRHYLLTYVFSFSGKIINDVDIGKVILGISNWCGPDWKLLYGIPG